jgi:inositol phosphorylceramide mannosyltransferase catalytic subunit
MIPKVLHQIWIGDQTLRPQTCMDTIKRDNPDWEYKLWTEKELHKLKISKKLELKIKCCKEMCGKADIYRYLILQQEGGIYIDADTISIEPLADFFLNHAGLAYENEITRGDLLAIGFMAFPPNHPLMDALLKHIETNTINGPAWQVTGNLLITNLVKKYNEQFKIALWPSYYFYPEHLTKQKYEAHGKVYLTQLWGSTHSRYSSFTNIKPQGFLMKPKHTIDIHIPEDISKTKMKDVLLGIKDMKGHYNINIHTKEDIKHFISMTRFCNWIKED